MRIKINFFAFSNDQAQMKRKMMGYNADEPIPNYDFHVDDDGQQ